MNGGVVLYHKLLGKEAFRKRSFLEKLYQKEAFLLLLLLAPYSYIMCW
jgi:hypothetical protein